MSCQCKTFKGTQCSRKSQKGRKYCWQHQNCNVDASNTVSLIRKRNFENKDGEYMLSTGFHNVKFSKKNFLISFTLPEFHSSIFSSDKKFNAKIVNALLDRNWNRKAIESLQNYVLYEKWEIVKNINTETGEITSVI